MIKITETVEKLANAQKERLYLYAPLGVVDQINLEARYWAKAPRSKDDIRLCGSNTFDDKTKKLSSSRVYHICLPETWAEAQIEEQLGVAPLNWLPGTWAEVKIRAQGRAERKPLFPIHAYYFVINSPQEFCILLAKTFLEKPHLLILFLGSLAKNMAEILIIAIFSFIKLTTRRFS